MHLYIYVQPAYSTQPPADRCDITQQMIVVQISTLCWNIDMLTMHYKLQWQITLKITNHSCNYKD